MQIADCGLYSRRFALVFGKDCGGRVDYFWALQTLFLINERNITMKNKKEYKTFEQSEIERITAMSKEDRELELQDYRESAERWRITARRRRNGAKAICEILEKEEWDDEDEAQKERIESIVECMDFLRRSADSAEARFRQCEYIFKSFNKNRK